MGSRSESLAAILSPPVVGGVAAAASTTATAALDLWPSIPDPYQAGVTVRSYGKNRMVTIQADGGDIYVALSSSNAGAIDPTATSSGFTGATQCIRIANGQERSFLLGGSAATRYLLHRTGSGTATLRAWASSPKTAED